METSVEAGPGDAGMGNILPDSITGVGSSWVCSSICAAICCSIGAIVVPVIGIAVSVSSSAPGKVSRSKVTGAKPHSSYQSSTSSVTTPSLFRHPPGTMSWYTASTAYWKGASEAMEFLRGTMRGVGSLIRPWM